MTFDIALYVHNVSTVIGMQISGRAETWRQQDSKDLLFIEGIDFEFYGGRLCIGY